VAKDTEAARAFLTERVLVGACTLLDEGAPVIVHETAAWSDAFCVRLVGKPECWWVNKGWVKPLPAEPKPDTP
jgi:hypothetical protein